MKFAFSFALLSVLVLAPTADAATKKYYKIDLRRDFRSTSVNLYPDGTPYYHGVDLLIPAARKNFSVKTEIFGEATCKFLQTSYGTRNTTIRVSTDIEIDDGSCEFTIRLQDGRKAVVHVENVGT